jgi:hypothetical protein
MSAKYRVERTIKQGFGYDDADVTRFTIERTGDGPLVRSDDPVLLNRICDLLNADEGGTGDSPARGRSSCHPGSSEPT